MRSAEEWFAAYGVSHQNKINKFIHWVCIPLIMFSILGILMAIPVPGDGFSLYFNFASFALLLASLFYLKLSRTLLLGFFIVGGLMHFVNYRMFAALNFDSGLMALVSIGIFVLAWIGQFIGHKIEGVKPSFFEDLQYLMIGPAWLLQFIYKKVGIKI